MDEKDKNEAQNSSDDNGSEKIKVNVTNGDEKEANEEPKVDTPAAEENEVLDDKTLEELNKDPEVVKEEAAQEDAKVEEPAPAEEPKPEEQPASEPESPAPAEEETVTETTEEPAKVDNTPDLVPSVQPAQMSSVSPPNEVAQLKKRNKTLKVWLVIFVVLFVALISAGVVYFNQQSKNSDSTAELEAQNAQLQQQLVEQQQNATQKTIDDLNSQLAAAQKSNEELTATNKDLEQQVTDLTTVATELKEACGTACDDIEIPTTDTTTTAQ